MNTTTDRFDELLPFYVNGTLAEADRSWVESYLREQPQAADELRWLRAVPSWSRATLRPRMKKRGPASTPASVVSPICTTPCRC